MNSLNLFSRYIVLLGSLARSSCPVPAHLEWVHLQDASNGFMEAAEFFSQVVVNTLFNITEDFLSVKFGLASFIDKPVVPFGYYEDYCFKVVSDLQPANDITAIHNLFNSIEFGSGNDLKEAQLDALYRASISYKVGWTAHKPHDKLLKLLTIYTDDLYHKKGDARKEGFEAPRFRKTRRASSCDFSEYVSVADLADVLELEDIFVVFIVTEKVKTYYRRLLLTLGNFGVVVTVEEMQDLIEVGTKIVGSAIEKACISNAVPAQHFVSPQDYIGFELKRCVEDLPAEMNKDAVLLGYAETLEECSHLVQREKTDYWTVLWRFQEDKKGIEKECYGSNSPPSGSSKSILGCSLTNNVPEMDSVL